MARVSWKNRAFALCGTAMVFGAVVVLGGCSNGGLAVATVSSANGELTDGYRVAAGDRVHVTVFDEGALSGDYAIDLAGDLTLPLIDKIPVDGKSTTTLAQDITEKLQKGGYVLHPRVSVEILSHRPFFILGEVKTPGEYPYSGNLTLDQAVAKAGGYTPRADKRSVVLRRQEWAAGRQIRLDSGTPLRIAPGDTVTVREAFF